MVNSKTSNKIKSEFTVKTIRELKKQLRSRELLPKYIGSADPILENGIIKTPFSWIHPEAFLDIFGPEVLRLIKKDISDEQLEKFIDAWKTKSR